LQKLVRTIKLTSASSTHWFTFIAILEWYESQKDLRYMEVFIADNNRVAEE